MTVNNSRLISNTKI